MSDKLVENESKPEQQGLEERRQNGYLPMRPAKYRRLWRLRSNAPAVLSPMPTQSKASPKKKKGRGLKTPRLMLPIWLG